MQVVEVGLQQRAAWSTVRCSRSRIRLIATAIGRSLRRPANTSSSRSDFSRLSRASTARRTTSRYDYQRTELLLSVSHRYKNVFLRFNVLTFFIFTIVLFKKRWENGIHKLKSLLLLLQCAIGGNKSCNLVVSLYVRPGSAIPRHGNNFHLSNLKCIGISSIWTSLS